MDDNKHSDQSDRRIDKKKGKALRARTIVIRCWQERIDEHTAILRGTVRDLSHGRSRSFEGLLTLNRILQETLEDGNTTLFPPGADQWDSGFDK